MGQSQSDRFMPNIRTLADIRADRGTLRQFGHNLKLFFTDVWLDVAVLVVLGITAACVWVAPHAFTRLFPVTFFDNSGDIVWTQFAYPYVEPPLNSTVVGVVCAIVPIAVILIAQLWIKSFTDAANGILGLLYALVTGTLFQVTLKKTIGGLRPHFLTVCEPELPAGAANGGSGFRDIMFTVEQVCRGDMSKINNALESFPSGHSQIAWAGFGYLAIYLFTHLHIQRQRRPSLWRMGFVVAPLLLATYIASSLVLSYNHHGYDVLAGSSIGFLVALLSYRMVYMSIWDRRCNAVPRCRYANDGVEQDIVNTETEKRKTSVDTMINREPVLPQ